MKKYTYKQIMNYGRIAPLPHIDLLDYALKNNPKLYELKDKRKIRTSMYELLMATKLYNR